MSQVLITESKLTGIGDAIRSKKGITTQMTLDEMATEISTIPTGQITTQSLSVTANGTYTAPSGVAYTPVVVNVPTGSIEYTDTALQLTASNNTRTVSLDDGKNYLIKVHFVESYNSWNYTINILFNGSCRIRRFQDSWQTFTSSFTASGGISAGVSVSDVILIERVS